MENPAKKVVRLDVAFDHFNIGRSTGFRWIANGILEKVYIDTVPFITVASIERAAEIARTKATAAQSATAKSEVAA